jgi:hypothetical protein
VLYSVLLVFVSVFMPVACYHGFVVYFEVRSMMAPMLFWLKFAFLKDLLWLFGFFGASV